MQCFIINNKEKKKYDELFNVEFKIFYVNF